MKSYREALKIAQEKHDKLLATDPRLRLTVVRLIELDGSVIEYDSAFYEIDDEWLYLFSEHHPVYVQHMNEVHTVHQYKLFKSHMGWGNESDIHLEGRRAYREGKTLSENPYTDARHSEWSGGWADARNDDKMDDLGYGGQYEWPPKPTPKPKKKAKKNGNERHKNPRR